MRVYPYGICLALSVLAGIAAMALRTRRRAGSLRTVTTLALLAIPIGFLCARLFFCLARFSWFTDKGIGWFFSFTSGGYMMYGALTGLLLACLLTSRILGESFRSLLDSVSVPALLTLGLTRLSAYAAGVGYGQPISEWFSVYAFSPEEYTGMSFFHLSDATFFYRFPFAVLDSFYGEANWAVCILMGLLTLLLTFFLARSSFRSPGAQGLYAAAMAVTTAIGYDCLRCDDVTKWGVAGVVKAEEVIGAFFLAALLAAAQKRQGKNVPALRKVLQWAALLGAMGVFIAMEFSLENKIRFLVWMPMDLCYLCALLSCLGMLLVIRSALKKAA